MKKKPTLITLEFHAEHLNKNITGRIECITPEMADHDLNCSTFKNRRLKESALQKYQSDFEEGRWKVNGEPIIYDNAGNLVNGFHRYTALSKSNVPGVLFFVVRGINPDAVSTIDCGAIRTLKDRVDIAGNVKIKNAATAGAAILLREGISLGCTLRDIEKKSGGLEFTHGPNLSDSKKIEIMEKEAEEINWCINLSSKVIGKSAVKLSILSKGTVAGLSLYWLTREKADISVISGFFKQLFGLTSDCSLIVALRNKLSKAISPRTAYHYVSTAWEYFKNGRTTISRLPKL